MGKHDDVGRAFGVAPEIDVAAEIERRTEFLVEVMARSGRTTLVLGISGGVDSATAAALCVRAARRHRERHGAGRFVALRLPYGEQADAHDADLVVRTVGADDSRVVDIRPATDALEQSLRDAGLEHSDPALWDRMVGNVKARQRMVVQYAFAETLDGLVVGTDHAAEAVTGFFTKYGDGGVDVVPLQGLTKRQVRALAAALGVPAEIVDKAPTADLETLRPLVPDEEVLGLGYGVIDDVLEGRGTPETRRAVVEVCQRTAHKRALPYGPNDPMP